MEENFYLQNYDESDALLSQNKAFKISHIKHVIKEIFRVSVANILHDSLKAKGVEIAPGYSHSHKSFETWNWFEKGLDCEILQVGAKGWQKGKVRIKVTLEFIPSEPEIEQIPEITEAESSLEDIRRRISEVTS